MNEPDNEMNRLMKAKAKLGGEDQQVGLGQRVGWRGRTTQGWEGRATLVLM